MGSFSHVTGSFSTSNWGVNAEYRSHLWTAGVCWGLPKRNLSKKEIIGGPNGRGPGRLGGGGMGPLCQLENEKDFLNLIAPVLRVLCVCCVCLPRLSYNLPFFIFSEVQTAYCLLPIVNTEHCTVHTWTRISWLQCSHLSLRTARKLEIIQPWSKQYWNLFILQATF